VELTEAEARVRFAAARVGRLATVDTEGWPHLVPVTFAVDGDMLVTAVDHKPKRSTNLKRLRNLESNDRVSVLVDHYDDEDWDRLWWVRADGTASVVAGGARAEPLRWLIAKYPQYAERPPAGPVIVIEVRTWRGWAYTS
jgi:PPOX class probable F420-dependent enzyme